VKILIQLKEKYQAQVNIIVFKQSILEENNIGLNSKVHVAEKYHLQKFQDLKLNKEKMCQDQESILINH